MHCKNCGLEIEQNNDNGWMHTDGYLYCPPAWVIHPKAEPEVG